METFCLEHLKREKSTGLQLSAIQMATQEKETLKTMSLMEE